MSLMKLGDSYYLSKYGSSDGGKGLLDKLRNINLSKYEITDSSLAYLMGMIDRKITNESKHEILKLLQDKTLKIINCKKEDGLPNYIIFMPMIVNGSINYYINIGYYSTSKKDSNEISDINPRTLFSLLMYGYAQYKLYTNIQKINDSRFCDSVFSSYKKILKKILTKLVSINTLTNEERQVFDVILSIYVAKVILRKENNYATDYVKSTLIKSTGDDNLENIINSIESEKINNFSDFIVMLNERCPNFKKVNAPLLLREYAISMKGTSVLSLDVLQIFVATLMSIDVGSTGIFNDKFVQDILDNKDFNQLRLSLLRM